MNRYSKYDQLLAPWKNTPGMREQLIARIRQQSKNSSSTQNAFTQQNIVEEYYKSWLQLPPTATIQIIAQHPLLDKQSKAKIDEQLQEQKNSQIKWSAGGTAFMLIVYSAFLSRMPRFRNFFNPPNSWMVTRGIKKFAGAYCIFLVWVASFTSGYEKALPQELQKKGVFKTLGILGKASNN